MEKYIDLNNDSGVIAYEIGSDYIIVRFRGNSDYTYSYDSAGRDHIENMKRLARSGDGLNSYINKYAKKLYVR